jgi:hypothetical protein
MVHEANNAESLFDCRSHNSLRVIAAPVTLAHFLLLSISRVGSDFRDCINVVRWPDVRRIFVSNEQCCRTTADKYEFIKLWLKQTRRLGQQVKALPVARVLLLTSNHSYSMFFMLCSTTLTTPLHR